MPERFVDLGNSTEADSAVEKMLEQDGTPAVLVNNAGVTQDGLFPRMKREAWDQVLMLIWAGFIR